MEESNEDILDRFRVNVPNVHTQSVHVNSHRMTLLRISEKLDLYLLLPRQSLSKRICNPKHI